MEAQVITIDDDSSSSEGEDGKAVPQQRHRQHVSSMKQSHAKDTASLPPHNNNNNYNDNKASKAAGKSTKKQAKKDRKSPHLQGNTASLPRKLEAKEQERPKKRARLTSVRSKEAPPASNSFQDPRSGTCDLKPAAIHHASVKKENPLSDIQAAGSTQEDSRIFKTSGKHEFDSSSISREVAEAMKGPSTLAKKRSLDASEDHPPSGGKSQGDSENGEHSFVTTEFLTSHCWNCHVRLKDTDDGIPCLYALHIHPILRVPCCCVCCENLASADDAINQDDATNCNTCGDDTGEELVCCDECPRVCCVKCVAQAWGGGERGRNCVNRLTNDGRHWFCLVCSPPEPLQELQRVSGDAEATSSKIDDSDDAAQKVLDRLKRIEEELEACESTLTEDNIQRVRREVSQDLGDDSERVDEEMELWEEMQFKHYDLVQDSKVDLLEQLNSTFGISADMFYKYLGKIPKESADQNLPDWAKAAEKEIAERKKSMGSEDKGRKEHANNDDDDHDSDEEEQNALSQVEDLGTISMQENWETEEIVEHRRQWRNNNDYSREKLDRKLEKYMERDDQLLRQVGTKPTLISTDQDERETLKEFAETSVKTESGMLIRRDEIQTLAIRKSNERSQDNEQNSGETTGADCLREPGMKGHSKNLSYNDGSKRGANILHWKDKPQMKSLKKGDHVFSEVGEAHALDDTFKSGEHEKIWDSCFELVSSDKKGKRTVSVASHLASVLKPHQVEGVKFLWRNSCNDLASIKTHREASLENGVGGCILAHMMGLGKSLQVVTLVHTLMYHPNLRSQSGDDNKPFISRILLIVPVNTISNWCSEFEKWTLRDKYPVRVFDVSASKMSARKNCIRLWYEQGGVFLVGSDMYARLVKSNENLSEMLQFGPEMVIIDEAHTLLKNETSQISKTLGPIRTKRRIILSGTPFVNNLKEYHKLADWVRSKKFWNAAEFERQFVRPIMDGLASDSTAEQVALQVQRTKQLSEMMAPFMQRRDYDILERDLPPYQIAVIYVRQTPQQSRLYRSFDQFAKTLKRRGEELPFITQYQMLRPLHNHPYCLLQSARGNERMDFSWVHKVLSKVEETKGQSVTYSNKIFLLLQIIANCVSIGDKIVVFSQCLKTLDFIEKILDNDWGKFCSGYEDDKSLKHWKKNCDYLRIDGSIQSSERGELVSTFHDKLKSTKLFLLSIEAGGIGINLVAANRVVLFDSHWNPTISSQAFHRCYRYGQEKPVYGYRLITEGTMEEKIFSRSISKAGIADRVVDQKYPERNFTARELAEIKSSDTWAQCDSCNKWRMVFFEAEEDLPERWTCTLNLDPFNKKCDKPERNEKWYEKNREKIMNLVEQKLDSEQDLGRDELDIELSEKADVCRKEFVKKDEVLVKIGFLGLFDEDKVKGGKKNKLNPISRISKVDFMEMLQSASADLDIEASHRQALQAGNAKQSARSQERSGETSKNSHDRVAQSRIPDETTGTIENDGGSLLNAEVAAAPILKSEDIVVDSQKVESAIQARVKKSTHKIPEVSNRDGRYRQSCKMRKREGNSIDEPIELVDSDDDAT